MPAILSKKETLAQVFPYQFNEVFKNTIFTEHRQTTASCYSEEKPFVYHMPVTYESICFLLVRGKISECRLEIDTKTGNTFCKNKKEPGTLLVPT